MGTLIGAVFVFAVGCFISARFLQIMHCKQKSLWEVTFDDLYEHSK